MKQIVAPGVYCREAGALTQTGHYAALLGANACLIGGKTALERAAGAISASLAANKVAITGQIWYGGECTWDNVARLQHSPEVQQAAVLIGVGGGRALDTCKLLAYKVGKPLITVPTIAATCAAWTMIGVVNDAAGTFVEVSAEVSNPQAVIVDTQIIAEAPARFLVAGMGDTLAKWYEGEASTRGKIVNQNGQAGLNLARLVRDAILQQGEAAIDDLRQGQPSQAVETIVDDIIMLAGMISNLGGDACRSAGAHSFYSALTLLPQVHAMLHGEVVGFGILCQLVMDHAPAPIIDEYLEFCHKVSLPVTLQALGIDNLTDEQLRQVAAMAVEVPDMVNMPFAVTAPMVAAAILDADAQGRQ
jgi:glycerol dehydrogenase